MDEEKRLPLTESELDDIAERAATKALELVYAQVGRTVLSRLLWFIGVAALGLYMWLSGKGVTFK